MADQNGPAAPQPASDDGAVAVVGMSCAFPGARDPDEFWAAIVAGRCAVEQVPADRWDIDAHYDPDPDRPDTTHCRVGGFVPDVDRFDPLFFGMSGRDAELADPQQRLFLEHAWKALEDAGYPAPRLAGLACGVFAGTTGSDLPARAEEAGLPLEAGVTLGGYSSVLVGRISYVLDLRGPSVAVDSACSSSLVALHLAVQSIRAGESELALAGGVFVSGSHRFHVAMSNLGVLSASGQCRPFDAAADGFVPGEGVGVLALKSLTAARRDGDHVYAVIRASAVNHDGATNGLTAPSARSQTNLEVDVYRRAGIDVRTIGYAEAHGTGTRLGDSVEAEALTRAHRRFTDERDYCALGSVKANIGHTAAAAGVAGVIKVIQAIRHRTIPPSINVTEPNELLALDDSPFYLTTEARPWPAPAGAPRRATVSAFGISGTNGHVLVEEAPGTGGHHRLPPAGEHLVPVSARTGEALREYALALADAVSRPDRADRPRLADVAYTLQERRTACPERLAVLAGSLDELADRLRAFAAGRQVAGVVRGRAGTSDDAVAGLLDGDDGQAYVALLVDRRRIAALARAWVSGVPVPWHGLHPGDVPRPVPLPTYRFAREVYRLPAPPAARAATVPAVPTPAVAKAVGVPQAPAAAGLFAPAWEPAPAPGGGDAPATLLLLGTDDDARHVRVRWPSTRLILVRPNGAAGTAGAVGGPALTVHRVDPARADDFDRLAAALAEGPVPDGVLHLWPLHDEVPDPVDRTVGAALRLVRAIGRAGLPVRRMITVIRHAAAPEPHAEAVAALAGSAGLAVPDLRFSTVGVGGDLPPAECVDRSLAEWHGSDPEVRHVGGARLVRRLRPADVATGPAVRIRPGAVCMITGGMGGLGRIVAAHLARRHHGRMVLVGRSPLTADGQAVLAALRGEGAADAVYLSADVADPTAARDLVARLRQRYGGTHVLVHAAGVLDPRPLTDVDDSGLAATLRPKVTGVLALDEATRDEDLDAVVLFSSAAAVLGDFGLGGYGVANRFLDAFGEWREARRAAGQRRGATAVLNWPLWADGGMHLPGEDLYLRSTGVVPLSTTDGLDILDLALARGWSQTVVLPAAAAGDQPPVGAVPAGAGTVQSGGASNDAPDDWPERLRSEVRAVAAEVLRLDADRLVPDENLSAFGFDSLSLKTYAQRLTDVFGVPVSPTLFFARGTLREVADHLADRHGAALRARYATAHLPADPAPHAVAAPPVHPVSAPAPVLAEGTAAGARSGAPEPPSGGPQPVALTRPRSAEPTPSGASRGGAPIAVVGMAGRFPGSPDLAAYWRNLVAGRDLIGEVPADRWDWRAVHACGGDTEGRSRSRWGGFIEGADHFDAAFFRISRREAELIDPQHRIFLETAWAALEDAGRSTTMLAGRRVGVFAGVQFREYGQLLEEAGIRVAQIGTGNEHAMLPNRLSYLLDVRGPSEAIDTACSGSLVAVHRAIRSLRSGESELAVAGGVSLMLTPRYHILTTQMGVASPTGRCRTFSANADGYVRGEGVGVVVLKPLERALTDGDHVYAVLRGSAVGHGGRASSPTAPNSRAQADLVLAAWDDAGVDAADISYVEAHGTGTELGDPVEVEGLREAFEEAGRRGGPTPVPGGCGLGSVKSQIGHLEPAAGIAGLIKVVLALRHGTLPATLHASPPNPYLTLDGSPFRVVDRAMPWPRPTSPGGVTLPRRAGLSSFGFGGTNAHVVLEEHVTEPAGDPYPSGEHVVVLSARTPERLRAYADRLATFLRDTTDADLDRARAVVADVLNVAPAVVDLDAPLAEQGMDLVGAATLAGRLGTVLGTALPPAACRPDTTVRALAARLPGGPALADIAYTLATGRATLSTRLATVVADRAELADRLATFAATGAAPGVLTGTVATRRADGTQAASASPEAAGVDLTGTDPASLARAWVSGVDVDWTARLSGRRLPLPTYPFAPVRIWFETTAGAPGALAGSTGDGGASPEARQPAGAVDGHPLAHGDGTVDGRWRMVTRLDGTEFFLRDHVVAGRRTLPGVAYLELARVAAQRYAGRPVNVLRDVFWARPVTVDAEPVELYTTVTGAADGDLRIEFRSTGGVPYGQARTGTVPDASAPPPAVDIPTVRARLGAGRDGADCYRDLTTAGFGYGPTFRCLRELYAAGDEALSRWALSDEAAGDADRFGLHPGILDGALHTLLGLTDVGGAAPSVPFSATRVLIDAPLPRRGWAYAVRDGAARAGVRRFDVTVTDDAGRVSVRLLGLAVRTLCAAVTPTVAAAPQPAGLAIPGPGPASAVGAALLFRARWRPADLPVAPGQPVTGRVFTVGVPATALAGPDSAAADVVEATPLAVFRACREAVRSRGPARLLVVHPVDHPEGAALAGLARTVRLENSRLRLSTVGTDGTLTASAVAAELAAGGDEVEVRYAGGRRLRIAWVEAEPATAAGSLLRPGAVALITGGAGGLGRIFAEYLARRGAGALVLVGRGSPDAGLAGWSADLGVPVVYEAADVSCPEQIGAVLDRTRSRFGGVQVVLHAAGVIRDGLLATKTDEQWHEVLTPKVTGVRVLDEATAGDELDLFVTFSSCTGLLGNPGQSEYGYANRYLDAFAVQREHLRARGERAGRTVSVAWPLWADGGMRVDEVARERLWRDTGLAPMPATAGLAAFEAALAGNEPQVGVMYGDPARLRARLAADTPSMAPAPTTVDLPAGPDAAGRGMAGPDGAGAASGSGLAWLEGGLIRICAELLKVDAAELDPEEELSSYGVDSIMMMSLMNVLEREYGVVVEPGVLAEHPTIRGMAAYLSAEGVGPSATAAAPVTIPSAAPVVIPSASAGAAPAPTPAGAPTAAPMVVVNRPSASADDGRIAVIGMAARLPGSPDVAAFWDNLRSGRHLVGTVPADRWAMEGFYSADRTAPQRSYSRWGGFLDDIYGFDAARFRIGDDDALAMDPHHRILLELAEELWHAAGYRPADLAGSRTGVYIGGGESNYVQRSTERLTAEHARRLIVNTIPNMMAARLADAFDLRGPAQSIDTACSSSLVAVHNACRDLRSGDCDQAVVGGVELLVDGYLHVAFSKAEVLSDDDRCYVFDERAKGLVIGEGAGLVLLKPYAAALRDGDDVLAVILGGAVNNDGRTMGLTVPSAEGQQEVLRRAYAAAGIAPDTVSYFEAHGTGTLLGDPIEIRAASRVHREYTDRTGYCGVGSVKSNIGHLLRAAGVASLVKTVLALRHRVIPPTLHCARPHARFRFPESPFYPVTRLQGWGPPHGLPRRAAVSSFGFGGTNAHLVLEEFTPPAGHLVTRRPLPPPTFRRRRYRLGWPVVDLPDIAPTLAVPAPAPPTRTATDRPGGSLEDLLAAVRDQRIDPDHALALLEADR
ncbi:SDR family NAD(P)-dependent oxidoreductase [Micromonospora sp. KC207]|uniref:SDR family NAD(P)-dependent oxidoreductase n=1 Tax=Micromonospora sp. KC207 TaxID=2530377 RepID=UPI001A9ED177|nr:SDR family NAD(P)-dependent oxidoreductase [Micromonospora sp. KC207]